MSDIETVKAIIAQERAERAEAERVQREQAQLEEASAVAKRAIMQPQPPSRVRYVRASEMRRVVNALADALEKLAPLQRRFDALQARCDQLEARIERILGERHLGEQRDGVAELH